MKTQRHSLTGMRRQTELELGTDTRDHLKTAEMFRLERKFRVNIFELLAVTSETGAALSHRLGVSEAVISKWRKRLKIGPIPRHKRAS